MKENLPNLYYKYIYNLCFENTKSCSWCHNHACISKLLHDTNKLTKLSESWKATIFLVFWELGHEDWKGGWSKGETLDSTYANITNISQHSFTVKLIGRRLPGTKWAFFSFLFFLNSYIGWTSQALDYRYSPAYLVKLSMFSWGFSCL